MSNDEAKVALRAQLKALKNGYLFSMFFHHWAGTWVAYQAVKAIYGEFDADLLTLFLIGLNVWSCRVLLAGAQRNMKRAHALIEDAKKKGLVS